jgi:nucleoside-diphosphate-sugar epimerase
MILTDPALLRITEADAEPGAFVHADDVAAAILRALAVKTGGHIRLTRCGPGQFNTSPAHQIPPMRPRQRLY